MCSHLIELTRIEDLLCAGAHLLSCQIPQWVVSPGISEPLPAPGCVPTPHLSPPPWGQTEQFPITRGAQHTSHFSGCWCEKSDGKRLKAGRACCDSQLQCTVRHGEKGMGAGT